MKSHTLTLGLEICCRWLKGRGTRRRISAGARQGKCRTWSWDRPFPRGTAAVRAERVIVPGGAEIALGCADHSDVRVIRKWGGWELLACLPRPKADLLAERGSGVGTT